MTVTPPSLTVTPADEYSLPVVCCAQLLASCAEVQEMFGVANAAAAFAKIDYPVRDVETYGPPLPGIIVMGLRHRAGFDGSQSGDVAIELFDVVDPDYAITSDQLIDWKNDTMAWSNRCGAILRQMKALSKNPLPDFGGVRFDAIRWHDRSYPGHAYRELSDDQAATWFRYHSFTVDWVT